MIIMLAVVCACSVHITVSASNAGERPSLNMDQIRDWLESIFSGTTAPDPNNQDPTPPSASSSSTDSGTNPTVPNPFDPNNTGSGTVTTDPTTQYYPPASIPNDVTAVTTTEPTMTMPPEEEDSTSFKSSLGDLLADDTAAIIVQTPTEPYTIGGLVVKDGDNDDNFTWQMAALVAAAVLFVVLAALVIALLVQRSKKSKEEDRIYSSSGSDSESSGPVPVEVMTPERIAELLGSAAATSARTERSAMTSAESAAAIKAAALMGQLTTYSDPLIRKYTEEPVMISPSANVFDSENISGAEILQATDSMLDDITGNEKYASDTSGLNVRVDTLDDILGSTETKYCPECNKPVAAEDIFCHSCGSYVG